METGYTLSLPQLPRCLYTTPEALELDGQIADADDEDPSEMEGSSSQPTPHLKLIKPIKTSHVKTKRRVVVIGNSLLKVTQVRYANLTQPTGKSVASLGPG